MLPGKRLFQDLNNVDDETGRKKNKSDQTRQQPNVPPEVVDDQPEIVGSSPVNREQLETFDIYNNYFEVEIVESNPSIRIGIYHKDETLALNYNGYVGENDMEIGNLFHGSVVGVFFEPGCVQFTLNGKKINYVFEWGKRASHYLGFVSCQDNEKIPIYSINKKGPFMYQPETRTCPPFISVNGEIEDPFTIIRRSLDLIDSECTKVKKENKTLKEFIVDPVERLKLRSKEAEYLSIDELRELKDIISQSSKVLTDELFRRINNNQ